MCNYPTGDMNQKPKSAYELLMEARKKKPVVTLWLTDDLCTRCHKPVRTDGKILWCSDGCILDAQPMKRKPDKDYMGFISDLIQ